MDLNNVTFDAISQVVYVLHFWNDVKTIRSLKEDLDEYSVYVRRTDVQHKSLNGIEKIKSIFDNHPNSLSDRMVVRDRNNFNTRFVDP